MSFRKAVLLGRRTEELYPNVFSAKERNDDRGYGYCGCEGGRRMHGHNELASELGIAQITTVVLAAFPVIGNLAAFLREQRRVLGGDPYHGAGGVALDSVAVATAITQHNDAGRFASARETYYAYLLPALPGAPELTRGQSWSEVVDTFDVNAPAHAETRDDSLPIWPNHAVVGSRYRSRNVEHATSDGRIPVEV